MIPLIQSLTSMVTVAILKPQSIFDDLESGSFTDWPASSYVHDGTLLEMITVNLSSLMDLGPTPALPATFAWASIAWRLVYYLTRVDEARERQLDAAPDNERISLPAPTRLEEAVLHLSRTETSETPFFTQLAEMCVQQHVLAIMEELLRVGLTTLGSEIDQVSRDRFRFLYLQVIRAVLASDGIDFTQDGLVSLAYKILLGERNQQDWVARNPRYPDPVVKFARDDDGVLRTKLLDAADGHYPLEVAPLLQFSSALVRGDGLENPGRTSTFQELVNKKAITQRLPQGFHEYRLELEEMNENRVALDVDLPQFTRAPTTAFPGSRRLLTSGSKPLLQAFMVIDANTMGVVLDDNSNPYIARWLHHHSALEYFYHLLSTYAVGSNKVVYATQEHASTATATQIIELFADILHSALQTSRANGDGDTVPPEVLIALCIGPEFSPDTVSVVLSILEEELLRQYQDPANEESLQLLVACTYFLQALVKLAPNRVWPWISRSRLLESDGNGGSLASILIGTEMVLGSYKFLINCIHLFQGLVSNAVEGSISRTSNTNRALTRFNAPSTLDSGTSEKSMSVTLLAFGKMLASIYETSLNWNYKFSEDRLRINIGICEAFSSILEVAYEVDDTPDLSAKLPSVIAPIANYITDLYLTKSENDLPTIPILSSLISGPDMIKSSTLTSAASLSKRQTQSTLVLSELLVRIAMLLDKPWTHLEQQLFKATPFLARLYVTSEAWKLKVVTLLETLVRGAVRVVEEPQEGGATAVNHEHAEPPSLLGHLGPKTAKNFMMVLSQLDEPLKIVDIQESVWNLLTAVVTCKQRWFALYLLTGSTPREMMRSKTKITTQISTSKSLLSRALTALSRLDMDMNDPPWRLWTAMLEFITSAQNHWSWAMGDLRDRKEFIQQLVTFLRWMSHQAPPVAESAITLRSQENKFASLAAELLAMYLHSSRQVGDLSTCKEILGGLTYLQGNALKLPEYKVALHSSLRKNIENMFPGVRLANFKHTTLYSQPYGPEYFYDTKFASLLLGHDRRWSGPRAGQGFHAELERANRNLSLVDSQIKLLQSWKLLALELSHSATKDPRITTCLIDVVQGCMEANADPSLPEALFGQLMVLRADLAFAVLKRLVEEKVRSEEARQLLGSVWTAIRATITDFDDVFSSQVVDYYRSLLRILYLTLYFYLISPSNADPNESAFRSSFRGSIIPPKNEDDAPVNISLLLLDILSDTVAKGFRSLATQLHADPTSASPSDFALLTALLQRITVIPEMSKSQNQIALLFANSNTLRYATSLFSWSDRLLLDTSSTGTPDDPLYGELTLHFLVTLSSIKSLAETMAVEGVLGQIAAANLMNYFRRPGGMGPSDKPLRLHSLWTKGVLPLCLNLLAAVGAPIAGEVSSFLNMFPEQLSRSSNALNSRYAERITLNLAAETHSLACIAQIIENFKTGGVALGVQPGEVQSLEWDREGVKEDVEGWLVSKGQAGLRERIIGDGTTAYEERVVEEVHATGIVLGVEKVGGGGA